MKRGLLFPIGGAEDKHDGKLVLRTFVKLAGGSSARITILPTASRNHELGRTYQELFSSLGVRSPRVLPLYLPHEADDPVSAETLARSTGIFLTGGDQNKITEVLLGTLCSRALLKAWREGAVVGGTSAGASAMSDPMIAGGSGGGLPYPGIVQLSAGLGLTRSVIIDQHFRERDRLGRLIAAVGMTPHSWGLGLDEDTAAILGPEGRLEVVGKGTATIVDGRRLTVHPVSESHQMDSEDGSMSVRHLLIHSLAHGQRFNLRRGSLANP